MRHALKLKVCLLLHLSPHLINLHAENCLNLLLRDSYYLRQSRLSQVNIVCLHSIKSTITTVQLGRVWQERSPAATAMLACQESALPASFMERLDRVLAHFACLVCISSSTVRQMTMSAKA